MGTGRLAVEPGGRSPFSCSPVLSGNQCSAEAHRSAETHRGLPDKSQQQEEQGNDRQDVHQGAEGLIRLRQLGEGGAVGSETGQQEVRHGEILGSWSGPVRWMEVTTCGPPLKPIPRERHPLQNTRRR